MNSIQPNHKFQSSNYKMTVSGYHGNGGDSFITDNKYATRNGMQFSTFDKDNDQSLQKVLDATNTFQIYLYKCSIINLLFLTRLENFKFYKKIEKANFRFDFRKTERKRTAAAFITSEYSSRIHPSRTFCQKSQFLDGI